MYQQDYKGDLRRKEKKLSQETIKETVEDGIVTKKQKNSTFYGDRIEPPFIKLYLDDIEVLYRLPKGQGSFLYALIPYMNYKGQITINSVMKGEIAEELKMKVSSFGNIITNFVKKDILQRVGKKGSGVYIINPYLIGKGKWEDIEGLRIQYKENGQRQIEPIFKEKEKEKEKEVDYEELKEEKGE